MRISTLRIVGPGPYGTRVVFSVTGGWAEGARIRGKVVGAGGDWMLVGSDGYGRLDVRGQLETDDGATIYFSYGGLLERNAKVQAASASRGQTGYDDQYFRITPRLETGTPATRGSTRRSSWHAVASRAGRSSTRCSG